MQDMYVGAEASTHKAQLELSYPMRNGIVRSWEEMSKCWGPRLTEPLPTFPSQAPSLASGNVHGTPLSNFHCAAKHYHP